MKNWRKMVLSSEGKISGTIGGGVLKSVAIMDAKINPEQRKPSHKIYNRDAGANRLIAEIAISVVAKLIELKNSY